MKKNYHSIRERKENFLEQLRILRDEYGEIRFRWWYQCFYPNMIQKSAGKKWARNLKFVRDLFLVERMSEVPKGSYNKYTLK